MKTPSTTTKSTKTVNILARYFVKETLAVIYLLVNGAGKRYIVTLSANGASGCVEAETGEQREACEYGHDCYHKLAVMEIEGRRSVHVEGKGTLAGFTFAVPQVEKPARKTREYSYEIPATIGEMCELVALHSKTTSRAKLAGLNLRFASMVDEQGVIEVQGARWYFDVDTQGIYEMVEIVPAMSDVCTENVLPDLPQIEEEVLNNEPLTEEAQLLFEQAEIVPADEPKTLKKVELVPLESREQVLTSIRAGVQQLVDFDPDYATNDNGMGPNGTDTIFMHSFADKMARNEAIPVSKWVKAAEKLQKYNRTQLGGLIPPMAVVERILTPQAPSTPPQAPTFANVDYRQKGQFGGQGFNMMRV